jgi:hypothetical protein
MGMRGKPSGESLGPLGGRVPSLVSPRSRAQRGCTANARAVVRLCRRCAGDCALARPIAECSASAVGAAKRIDPADKEVTSPWPAPHLGINGRIRFVGAEENAQAAPRAVKC